MLAATRGIAGFGAGMLISEYLGSDRRRVIGWALFLAGALSTIPIGIRLFRRRRSDESMAFPREPRRPNAAAPAMPA